jgi:hypothetical protein
MAEQQSPSQQLDALVQEALAVSRKARRHRKSLNGDNFYGNKLAQLRSDATNVFAELADPTVGDTSALAELIEAVFAAHTTRERRVASSRELSHALRTKWKQRITAPSVDPGNELFPLALITKTRRGYLLTITKQMNGCLREAWYDGCAVMMRRLIEIVLIEAFEHQGAEGNARDASGNYLHLSDLIDRALVEPTFTLSRNCKSALPKLRNIGHRSAHGRYFTAQLADITKVEDGVRVVVEEFLNHAGLL